MDSDDSTDEEQDESTGSRLALYSTILCLLSSSMLYPYTGRFKHSNYVRIHYNKLDINALHQIILFSVSCMCCIKYSI